MSSPTADGFEPLLPAFAADPQADRRLRDNLAKLRDLTPDRALRDKLDAVLSGKSQLRDLARDPAFDRFMGPLVTRGAQLWQAEQDAAESSSADGRGGVGGSGVVRGDRPPHGR